MYLWIPPSSLIGVPEQVLSKDTFKRVLRQLPIALSGVDLFSSHLME